MLSIGFGGHLEFLCVNYDYGTYLLAFVTLLCFTRSLYV